MRVRCPECRGRGTIQCDCYKGLPIYAADDCPKCGGCGSYICPLCNGDGEVEEKDAWGRSLE